MSYFKEDFVDSENENSLNADEMNMKQSNDQVGTIYMTDLDIFFHLENSIFLKSCLRI